MSMNTLKTENQAGNFMFIKRFALSVCVSLTAVIAPLTVVEAKPINAVEQVSTAEIQSVLAPIALYPDTLLSHILIAATYPLEIVQAHRWREQNRRLEAEDAVNAAELEGWDPSVAALVAFPEILEKMSMDLEWTQLLGELFLADENRLLREVQYLREKAYAQGNLQRMDNVKVVREKTYIYIEPAYTDYLYVPYYDTSLIFGPWWWPHLAPRQWFHHRHGHRAHTTFYWGPRISLSSHFFFSAPRWHEHRVVVMDHHRHKRRVHHARDVSTHRDARYWQHKAEHRRNIRYANPVVRDRYSRGDLVHREREKRHQREHRREQVHQGSHRRNEDKERSRTSPRHYQDRGVQLPRMNDSQRSDNQRSDKMQHERQKREERKERYSRDDRQERRNQSQYLNQRQEREETKQRVRREDQSRQNSQQRAERGQERHSEEAPSRRSDQKVMVHRQRDNTQPSPPVRKASVERTDQQSNERSEERKERKRSERRSERRDNERSQRQERRQSERSAQRQERRERSEHRRYESRREERRVHRER